jgi:hypothetical protein
MGHCLRRSGSAVRRMAMMSLVSVMAVTRA